MPKGKEIKVVSKRLKIVIDSVGGKEDMITSVTGFL